MTKYWQNATFWKVIEIFHFHSYLIEITNYAQNVTFQITTKSAENVTFSHIYE